MRLFSRKPTPIPCREVVEAVTAYLEGTMPAGDRARLQAHLTACDHCNEYVEQIRATIALTGAIEPQDLSPEAASALSGAFRAWAAEGA
jgi:anti-sigma factor RsiW